MSAKTGTYIALIALFMLGAVYVYSASQLGGTNSATVGPGYFPTILGVTLMILCVVSGIQNFRKQDRKIAIPNLRLIWLTVALMAAFFLAWQFIGFFYVLTFLFFMILFTVYRPPKEHIVRTLLTNAAVALVLLAFIYVVFDLVLKTRF